MVRKHDLEEQCMVRWTNETMTKLHGKEGTQETHSLYINK